jgi:hypothetical protein
MTESKRLSVVLLVAPYDRNKDVSINRTAIPVVILVRKFPAPELPKTVWLEPPKTAPTSAPLPVCRRTTQTMKKHAKI